MIPEAYRKYEPVVTVSCVNFNAAWGDKAANLVKVVSENKGTPKDMNTMKTAFDNIGKAYDACHENYRVKNK